MFDLFFIPVAKRPTVHGKQCLDGRVYENFPAISDGHLMTLDIAVSLYSVELSVSLLRTAICQASRDTRVP